jgi:hypothetical protein
MGKEECPSVLPSAVINPFVLQSAKSYLFMRSKWIFNMFRFDQGFGEKCTPRGQCTFGPRLSEDDIKILASFVKSQAQNGWPKIEGDGD